MQHCVWGNGQIFEWGHRPLALLELPLQLLRHDKSAIAVITLKNQHYLQITGIKGLAS